MMTTYIQNRKAKFNFEILETFEAGLVLYGFEVKAIRAGKGKIEGGHVIIRGDEAFLVDASITEFQPANTPAWYEKDRPRKLLLNKKQIAHLAQQTDKAGLTAIPLRLYNARHNIKLEFALARGKKKHDKRETIKERDTKRDIERTLKNQY